MSKKTKKAPNSKNSGDPIENFTSGLQGVITLLLKDHKAMRKLMTSIQSPNSSATMVQKTFGSLKKLVKSHMASEERALVNFLKTHPKFSDEAKESYEEHRIHELIFSGIGKLTSLDRKTVQMKIYCEMLEHHLKEEEKDLFPKYKAYFAISTAKKAGKVFVRKRVATSRGQKKLGALSKVKK